MNIIMFSFFLISAPAWSVPSENLWDVLTAIHPASTKPTPKIQGTLSKPVELVGYTVVDETIDGEIGEFLFSKTSIGCIHDPLPTPNFLIHVTMPKGKTTPNYYGQKVVLKGTLSMGSRNDATYEMVAESVKPVL